DAVPVELTLCGIGEQSRLLREGHADLALLHRPWDDLSGFDTEDLVHEEHVAVLPSGHRLADRVALTIADLDGEPQPRWPGAPETSAPLVPDSGPTWWRCRCSTGRSARSWWPGRNAATPARSPPSSASPPTVQAVDSRV